MNDKAIFSAVGEILKQELSKRDERIDEISQAQESLIRKAVVETINSDELMEKLRGAKGEDAVVDYDALRDMIISCKEFTQSLKGEKGETPEVDTDEIVQKLVPYIPKVKDGNDAVVDYDTLVETVKANESLIERLRGEKGDTPELNIDDIVKELVPHIPEPVQAKDGVDGIGIKAVEQEDTSSFALVLDNDQTIEVALPKAEKGEQGVAGEKGLDGLDRPILDVRKACAGLEKHEVVYHNGGLYQATKKTIGTPNDDAGAYRLLLNGIDKAEFGADIIERKYNLILRKTDGEQQNLSIDFNAGYVHDPKTVARLFAGDFTLEGTKLKVFDGDDWDELQLRGRTGRAGKTGTSIKDVSLTEEYLRVTMTDGKHYDLPIIEKVMELLATEFKELLIDFSMPVADDIDEPIKRYAGIYDPNKTYDKGDVVTTYQGLYLALKRTSEPVSNKNDWAFMLGVQTSGGAGGGGGGTASTSKILADGALNMGGFGIQNMGPPRTGLIGKMDAVNRDTMEKAIAAGALYQGIYTVETNHPDLSGKTDAGFTPPAAGTTLADPDPGTTTPISDPGNILTWHNWKGNGFDSFTVTTTAPTPFEVRLSDGTIHKFNIPAGTYADEAALKAELDLHGMLAGVGHFYVYVNGADCHIGVETTAPIYCTAIGGETGNAFPPATIGPGNSVLNTFNYVGQTRDPNVDEALPPGIPGIVAGTPISNSDVLQYSSAKQGFEIISGSSLTQSFSDQRYWQVNGNNMRWVDQAYNKGSIVYDEVLNAWFVATQNIPVGSPKPGTIPAAAIWRKINSTYGATVFFGRGDYDPSDTTAANNWGMPAGKTYPSGQQPLNGDAYYDVTSGAVTDFSVVTPAPVFTITGSFDPATNPADNKGTLTSVPVPGQTDALTFGVDAAAAGYSQGAYYLFQPTTGNVTATGGYFNGDTYTNNSTYYFVYSGDPDADNGGWVVVDATAGAAPWSWTTNTPHAQVVPDVITPNTVWGFRRNFEITLTGVADDDWRCLIKQIPTSDGITHVEIRDKDIHGSTYEFKIAAANGATTQISPVIINPANSHLKIIGVGYDGGRNIYVNAQCLATADNATYEIIVTTYDYDLSPLQVCAGDATDAPVAWTKKLDGQIEYPGDGLTKFLQSKSGDASATIPASKKPGDNLENQTIPITAGTIHETRGFFWRSDTDGIGLVRLRHEDSTPIALGSLQFLHNYHRRIAPGNNGADVWPINNITSSSDPGFFPTSKNSIKKDYKARWHLIIDRRDPHLTYVEWNFDYVDAADVQCSDKWIAYWPKTSNADDIGSFYYSGFTGASNNWRGFTD